MGDTVTATWNNTSSGDNNTDAISAVTVNFSQFGGGTAVAATNASNTWTATYVIVAGSINASNCNVSVTATDSADNQTTTTSTNNATVNNEIPKVTAANISISGASGTSGVFGVGDTVTATWNNTASGDNNANAISSVTVNFSQFGGGTAVAATNNSEHLVGHLHDHHRFDRCQQLQRLPHGDRRGGQCDHDRTNNATVDNMLPIVTAAQYQPAAPQARAARSAWAIP